MTSIRSKCCKSDVGQILSEDGMYCDFICFKCREECEEETYTIYTGYEKINKEQHFCMLVPCPHK